MKKQRRGLKRYNVVNDEDPWPRGYKTFSGSIQLSMKFKMLINIEIAKIHGIFRFNLLKPAIYPANKC